MKKENLGIVKKGKGDAIGAKNAIRKTDTLVRSKCTVAVGKPFQKGDDPRRHKFGRVSLDRAAFAVKLNNFLCNGEGDPEELAKILWRYVRKGESWAVREILDRILGRAVQPIEVGETPKRITYIVKYADDLTILNETPAPSPTDEKAEPMLMLSRKS